MGQRYTETVESVIPVIALPEPRLAMGGLEVYALILTMSAYERALEEFEDEGWWYSWQSALSPANPSRMCWYMKQAQPEERHPEPFMKRSPHITPGAAEASVTLLSYAEVRRVPVALVTTLYEQLDEESAEAMEYPSVVEEALENAS